FNHGSLRSRFSLRWTDGATRGADASSNAFSCSSDLRAHCVACDNRSNDHACMAWLRLLGACRRSRDYELRLYALHLDRVSMAARSPATCIECDLAAPVRWKPDGLWRGQLLRA